MPLPIASVGRTYSQALNGTPTAVAIPAADVQYDELLLFTTGSLNVRFVASDTPFPVSANTVFQLPLERGQTVLVDGSGTLNIMALGTGGNAGWKN